jgi:hypothetical protein
MMAPTAMHAFLRILAYRLVEVVVTCGPLLPTCNVPVSPSITPISPTSPTGCLIILPLLKTRDFAYH